MSAATPADTSGPQSEWWTVKHWRQAELERAGWPPVAAISIADRHDIDLHDACQLVRDGCPVDLALVILL